MSVPTLIGAAAVLAELERAAREHPDRVVSPRYILGGEPCCIAAVVLSRIGVPMETLAALDDVAYCAVTDPEARSLPLSLDAREILGAAQEAQDYGDPWSDTVAPALDRARELGVIA